jgi:hypothetical protein
MGSSRASARFAPRAPAALLALLACGCGVLGPTDGAPRVKAFSTVNAGCLDNLSSQSAAYVEGKLAPEAAERTWTCVQDAIRTYRALVRASDPRGYTRVDVRALLDRFLFSRAEVSDAFVAGLFELKASLLGGDQEVLATAELDRLERILSVARAESLRLLPEVRLFQEQGEPRAALRLSREISASGLALGRALEGGGSGEFRWATAFSLIDELERLTGAEFPGQGTRGWIGAAKTVLLGGSPESVSGGDWVKAIEIGSAYMGAITAARRNWDVTINAQSGLGETEETWLAIADIARPAMLRTIQLHGGSIPLADLDRWLDALPEGTLGVEPSVLKSALRPLVGRLLKSGASGAIDALAVERAHAALHAWLERLGHLRAIYHRAGAEELSPEEFAQSAAGYGAAEPAAAQVADLVALSRGYRALPRDPLTGISSFVPYARHAEASLEQLLWAQQAARFLVESYGSDPVRMRASEADVKAFIDDYRELALKYQWLESLPDVHVRRFRDVNLFVFNSDGDDALTVPEITDWVRFAFNAGKISGRLRRRVEAQCRSLGKDPLGWSWVEIGCFREEFHQNRATHWGAFPGLLSYYDAAPDKLRRQIEVDMEQAARLYGYNPDPIGSLDAGSYAALFEYLETLYLRFDRNGDGMIDTQETLAAYPLFRLTLAKLAKHDPDDKPFLEAVLTYTAHHGEPPAESIGGIAHFLLWKAVRPFWDLQVRRADFLKVLAKLGTPEPNGGKPIPD